MLVHKILNRLFPLTKIPKRQDVTISDLFFWVCDSCYSTYYVITDLIGIFNFECPDGISSINLKFFSCDGELINSVDIDYAINERIIINIGEYLDSGYEEPYGTFVVSHRLTQNPLAIFDSYVSDRGYVAYSLSHTIFKNYIHGNLDAVALCKNGEFQYLHGSTLYKRSYNQQYIFKPENRYVTALINACDKEISYHICYVSIRRGKCIFIDKKKIKSGGCLFYTLKSFSESFRIVIKSQAIMPRPIIFKFVNQTMDVFHG